MARKKPLWRRGVDARYWRYVDAQDQFWRETIVAFIKPLRRLYQDPLSAGAFILSRFMDDPSDAARIFKAEPEAFGALLSGAVKSHAKEIYADLLSGRQGPALELCAQQFKEARAASHDLALLAIEHPSLYQELQKERAGRISARERTRVQFLGRSVYVSLLPRPTKRRDGKVDRPPKIKD